MADINRLARILDGVVQGVSLSSNTLVVLELKVGGDAGTVLTKAILDNLVTLQNGSDIGASVHHHDGLYYRESELGSTTNGSEGVLLIGDGRTYSNFTGGANLGLTLDGIDSALSTAGSKEFLDTEFRIQDNGDNTKKIAFQAAGIATATTRIITMPDANVDLGLVASAIQSSEKGANSGVATLNASGKLTSSQVPAIAITDTFVVASEVAMLALSAAETGDVAVRTDLNKTFILKGTDYSELTDWQELLTPTDAVSSVNGQTGVVVLDTDNISEGTNKYFSNALAKAAAVADSITDGITDVAPSQNAVFDALALKQAASANLDEADTFFGATDISGAEAETLTDGSNADGLHKHSQLSKMMVAGEEFTAGNYFVRIGAGGKVFKADYDASSNNNFYAYGIVQPSSTVDVDANISVILMGEITLGSNFFEAGEVGEPVHLMAAGAFDAVSQITYAADQASYRVGVVSAVNKILVGNAQLLGIN